MAESLLHESWYRVAALKPRLRDHVRFHRHRYRGQLWYVLQDPSAGRSHRLTPGAYHLAALMDGERTAHDVWEAANTLLGDDGPTQGETIRLLGMLHSADVLRCDVPPDTAELLARSRRKNAAEWWRPLLNPLSIRVPLADPDALLDRALPWVRPLFRWPIALLWLACVGAAGVAGAFHWSELTADASGRLLDPRNLLLLWVLYPLVKGLHEAGHALATKVWGGEVHEMGIVFLVGIPVPYVDASAASVFPEKHRRVIVGAAGMMVELWLASLAMAFWIGAEPGLLRLAAYNVIWIGGASTLLFNGNPLLRFDGYYVLADAIESPNLSARSQQYLGYLARRRAFGLEQVRRPLVAPREEAWLVGYGVLAFVYRTAILVGIALFVAGRFFVLGVLLAALALVMGVGVPAVRQLYGLLFDPHLAGQRARPVGVVAAGLAVLLLAVCVVPVPLMTRAEGVVWPPEGAQVRAGADGFVVRVLAEPGTRVERGTPLLLTRAPTLSARVEVLSAELAELVARQHAERRSDLVRAQITQDEVDVKRAALERARERVGEVVVRSPGRGAFLVERSTHDLVGRFVEEGELIGYVVGETRPTARVVLPQSDVALVRGRTHSVELRLAERPDRVHESAILREIPEATAILPSAALGLAGGGRIPVDPGDPDGRRALEPFFRLDVALPPEAAVRIGGRVHVRFHHGAEPIAIRVVRGVRRVFLGRLGV